ncbi:MAG: DUF2752 domain-containing protein [Nocardioides sp.]|uniref:DUF2752 domain-containing protein n=1 Tax=Nocardioides sp. TaxID=35761 RepID=UPI0039E30801
MTSAAQSSLTDLRGRRQRLSVPLTTLGALGAATAALRLRDPHESGSWGYCPSYLLFGVYCPGCGGLRAVNDLTHGDLIGAASSNLLFVLALPLIAWVFGVWLWSAWTGRPARWTWWNTRAFRMTSLTAIVVFTVLRNLSIGSWLAP